MNYKKGDILVPTENNHKWYYEILIVDKINEMILLDVFFTSDFGGLHHYLGHREWRKFSEILDLIHGPIPVLELEQEKTKVKMKKYPFLHKLIDLLP